MLLNVDTEKQRVQNTLSINIHLLVTHILNSVKILKKLPGKICVRMLETAARISDNDQ